MTTSEDILRTYARSASDALDGLTQLDQLAGDGDFGHNLNAGLALVLARLDAAAGTTDNAFSAAADVFLDEVGGTSGPLFGLLFQGLARSATPGPPLEPQWAAGARWALSAIQRVGEATVGDRTMVDALAPAVAALEQDATWADVAAAAFEGARATAELVGRMGRSSYVGERALGRPDPGAVGVALLFAAAATVLDPGGAPELDVQRLVRDEQVVEPSAGEGGDAGPWTGYAWHDRPPQHEMVGARLRVTTAERTDFWRETLYGFTRDDGHFYGRPLPSGRSIEVSFTGNFEQLYDQAGLMLRADPEHWIKAGVEFNDGRLAASSVVTAGRSDWAVTPLPDAPPSAPRTYTVRASRDGGAVTIRYRIGTEGAFQLLRVAPFPADLAVSAGVMCCSPTRAALVVTFDPPVEGIADGGLHDEPGDANHPQPVE